MNNLNKIKNELLNKIDIVDFISQFVELKKRGNTYIGYSPFKSENTASFTVSPFKNIFKDFSSQNGGNVIKFYSLYKNISYNEAIIELAKKYNINTENLKNYELKESIYNKILYDVSKFFHENLLNNKIALEYLEKRGYDIYDIKKYNLGYASDTWDELYNYIKDKYDIEKVVETGIIQVSTKDSNKLFDAFRNRIMFPISNQYQQIIGFGGRYIGNDTNVPKYINSNESKIFDKGSELYGIFDRGISLKNNKFAILTEGYLDVLSINKNGFENVVASLGTAFTDKHAKLLKKFVNSVLILFDNDEAGKKATENAIYILNKNGFNIKCLTLEDGIKDPDEFFRKYTSDDFSKYLKKNSLGALEYLFNNKINNLDIENSIVKREIIDEFKNYFYSINNKIIYNEDLKLFSNIIGVEKEILESHYNKKFIENNNFIKPLNVENNKIIKNNLLNKREQIEITTIEYLMNDKKIEEKYKNFLKEFKISGKYLELNKKLLAINYNLSKLNDIYLEEYEDELIMNIILNENIILTEENYIRLIKIWLQDILISELEEKEDIIGIDKVKFKLELGRIKNSIKNSTLYNELVDCYNQIKEVRGENNGY